MTKKPFVGEDVLDEERIPCAKLEKYYLNDPGSKTGVKVIILDSKNNIYEKRGPNPYELEMLEEKDKLPPKGYKEEPI